MWVSTTYVKLRLADPENMARQSSGSYTNFSVEKVNYIVLINTMKARELETLARFTAKGTRFSSRTSPAMMYLPSDSA